ncbi:hypothetical protein C1645_840134 [Glomus cerebriforme]|uniref:Uncharacterized protein n=1 Tax=Glomus cerebriforme TaxID=658196 RepID=A0A397S170_9GLOM|nr:hypothetical protein C1645_840134 [Glomus cerebriforme]
MPGEEKLTTTKHYDDLIMHNLKLLQQYIIKCKTKTAVIVNEKVQIAIHTHGIVYLSNKSIPELIDNNAIRADMPDPNSELELYKLVENIKFILVIHIPAKYITTQFAKYMIKYVIKSELTNISKPNAFQKHILTRHLDLIELMILLLGYSICQLSIAVEFLPSIPPK